MGLDLYCRDSEAAAGVERLCSEWAAAPAATGVALGQPLAEGLTPASAYTRRVLWDLLQRTPPRRRDAQVQLGFRGEPMDQVAAIASLAMLLPNSQGSSEIAGRLQTCDAMQRLARAMRAFALEHQQLPSASDPAADGRPPLSWRVHLLPYLGQRLLYQQFRLDEPWDSSHNQALISQMPEIFQHPNRSADGKTTYLVPVGVDALSDPSDAAMPAGAFSNSNRKLLLVDVAASQAVVWTQPNDLEFDAQHPWECLGDKATSGFVGVRADGTVEFFPPSLSPQDLRQLFTGNTGHSSSP